MHSFKYLIIFKEESREEKSIKTKTQNFEKISKTLN